MMSCTDNKITLTYTEGYHKKNGVSFGHKMPKAGSFEYNLMALINNGDERNIKLAALQSQNLSQEALKVFDEILIEYYWYNIDASNLITYFKQRQDVEVYERSTADFGEMFSTGIFPFSSTYLKEGTIKFVSQSEPIMNVDYIVNRIDGLTMATIIKNVYYEAES